jgi:DNA-binding response OmpR family regulator
VLVVEDEPGIVDFVARGLRSEGFTVLTAGDGRSGIVAAESEAVDIVVLDVLLPQIDGLTVLGRLRQTRPRLPVILLTALGELDDRVRGLDAGAVDYLSKPFAMRELVARIRAQLRAGSGPAAVTALRGAGLQVDLITRQVLRGGEPVRLSGTEFELLAHLMRNAGRVLPRAQILRAVWGIEHESGTNVVDVYVGYLRKKLARDDWRAPIVTVRSVGYRFDGSVAAA